MTVLHLLYSAQPAIKTSVSLYSNYILNEVIKMKQLRKCAAILLGALCISTCLTACGGDSSSKGSAEDKIVGEWEGKGSVFSDRSEITFTFNKSGTGSFKKESAKDPYNFNWDIDGDDLTISETDGRYPYTQSYKFSNDDRTLTLVYHSDYDNKDYTYTYHRID